MVQVSGFYKFSVFGSHKSSCLEKISNKTMLGIKDVVWTDDGNAFIALAINEDNGERSAVLATMPESTTSSLPYNFTETLKRGASGESVRYLQITLNKDADTQISSNGAGSPGNETNKFGSLTEIAVQKFQNKHSVPETGEIDDITLKKLNEIHTSLFPKQDNSSLSPFIVRELGNINSAISIGKSSFFYIVSNPDGGATAILDKVGDLPKKDILLTLPTSEWILEPVNDSTLTLQSKSSGYTEGFFYTLNLKTGGVERILGNLNGLVALMSPKGSVMYTTTDQRGKNTTSQIQRGDDTWSYHIIMLPEKCVWGVSELLYCASPEVENDLVFPDSLYKGVATSFDTFWMINPESREDTMLFNDAGNCMQ